MSSGWDQHHDAEDATAHNDRTEAIARWAFTAFCALVIVGWLAWGALT